MIAFLLVIGGVIIAGLAFYAGRLLFMLRQQQQRQARARASRIDSITQSIQTIAMAMSQQQCDLSEGVIRICNLLNALPLDPQPAYSNLFPHIHGLFNKVDHFATHEARMALSKQERRQQDKTREEIESQYENQVLEELEKITNFCSSLD